MGNRSGCIVTEIARQMGVSVVAADALVRRALRQLRESGGSLPERTN